jgi:hypothetical protein
MADTKGKTINQESVPTKSLLKRFKEAETARKKYDKTWARNMRLYKSKAWEGIEDIAWFQSHPQYNKVFEFVETMRGFLADNKWGLDVIPASLPPAIQKAVESANPADKQAAVQSVAAQVGVTPSESTDLNELLNEKCVRVNKMLDFLWLDCRMQSKLAETLMHVFLKGTGIVKSTFDPDNVGEAGIGQIETKVIDPTFFYPDPHATSMHDGSIYFEKHPVSVRWVLENYPDRAQEFIANAGQSTMSVPAHGDKGEGALSPDEGKALDIIECWYKDSAIAQDDDAESGTKKGEKLYPNGRYTVMTDKGFALDDKPSEYETMHPYVRFVEIPMAGEFWGDCTVDKVAELQILINQVMRSIVDNAMWLVHGIWIADDISGVDSESLAGYGMRDVVVKKVGSEVRRDVGEPLPHSIFQLYQDLVDAFDRVAGIPDVMRGIVPSRQPVQTTQLQQESGEVRTRERSRRVEESLEDLGKLWLSIVSKFWVDKRTIRSGQAIGGFDIFQLSRKDMEGWRFDLHVRPGSTTPLDLTTAFDRAKAMRMELQIDIPDEFFLRLAQIPGLEAAYAANNKAAADANSVADEPTADEMAAPDQQGEADQFPDPSQMDAGAGFDPAGGAAGGMVPPEQLSQFP